MPVPLELLFLDFGHLWAQRRNSFSVTFWRGGQNIQFFHKSNCVNHLTKEKSTKNPKDHKPTFRTKLRKSSSSSGACNCWWNMNFPEETNLRWKPEFCVCWQKTQTEFFWASCSSLVLVLKRKFRKGLYLTGCQLFWKQVTKWIFSSTVSALVEGFLSPVLSQNMRRKSGWRMQSPFPVLIKANVWKYSKVTSFCNSYIINCI